MSGNATAIEAELGAICRTGAFALDLDELHEIVRSLGGAATASDIRRSLASAIDGFGSESERHAAYALFRLDSESRKLDGVQQALIEAGSRLLPVRTDGAVRRRPNGFKWRVFRHISQHLQGATPPIRTNAFWSFSGAPIQLVGGEVRLNPQSGMPAQDQPYLVQAGDIAALLEGAITIARAAPAVPISFGSANQLSPRIAGLDLVSVGGPSSNPLTRRLLSGIEAPWRLVVERHEGGAKTKYLMNAEADSRLDCEPGEPGEYDCCFLGVRAPSPLDPSRTVFVFAGLSTYGVLAAMRAVSSSGHPEIVAANLETLMRVAGEGPVQFVGKTPVVNGDVPTPLLDEAFVESLPGS